MSVGQHVGNSGCPSVVMSEMRYAGPSVCRIFRMSASWSVRNTVCRLVEMSEIRDNGRSLCRIYTGRSVSYIRYVGRRVCRKSDRSEIRSGSSSETVVVKKNLVSRKNCAVTAMVGYRQAAETVQWSLAEGQGSCSQAF